MDAPKRPDSLASQLFVQEFVQTNIDKIIKDLRFWPFVRRITGGCPAQRAANAESVPMPPSQHNVTEQWVGYCVDQRYQKHFIWHCITLDRFRKISSRNQSLCLKIIISFWGSTGTSMNINLEASSLHNFVWKFVLSDIKTVFSGYLNYH